MAPKSNLHKLTKIHSELLQKQDNEHFIYFVEMF